MRWRNSNGAPAYFNVTPPINKRKPDNRALVERDYTWLHVRRSATAGRGCGDDSRLLIRGCWFKVERRGFAGPGAFQSNATGAGQAVRLCSQHVFDRSAPTTLQLDRKRLKASGPDLEMGKMVVQMRRLVRGYHHC